MSAQTQSPDITALDELVARLKATTEVVIDGGHVADVLDEAIAQALYAAARLFSAKNDKVAGL